MSGSGDLRRKVLAEVQRRGLASFMNQTKWTRLQEAVQSLAFPPAFQRKDLLRDEPEPEHFDEDVAYWGDWTDEALGPHVSIEWIRVRPRMLRHRGRLVEPATESIEAEFVSLLEQHRIPYRQAQDSVWIFGYARVSPGGGAPG